jgi:C-terminal processing protease CtpA/Prc
VLRDGAGAPVLSPEVLTEFERKVRATSPTPAPPTDEDEPVFKVTKADPGISFKGDTPFDENDLLGVTFAFQASGALVLGSVKADSIGEELGFKAGDPVVEINHQQPPQRKEARQVNAKEIGQLAGIPAGKVVLFTVQKSDGKKVSFHLKATPQRSPAK